MKANTVGLVQKCMIMYICISNSPSSSSTHTSLVGHSESSFDTVLSGVLPPATLTHSSDLLAEVARILKPSGTLLMREPVTLQG